MSRLPSEQFLRRGDDIAPGFEISISGRDTSEATSLFSAVRPLVQSVVYEEDEEMSSLMEINIINQPDTGPGRPVDWRAVIDSKAFQEGNFIDLWMGYGNSRHFMDRGEIVKWLPRFSSDGPQTITLKAFDGRHRMARGNQFRVRIGKGKKQRKTAYRNTPDEDIVKRIAQKYGYGVRFDIPEARKKKTSVLTSVNGVPKKIVRHVFPTRVQGSGVSDWDFLRRLAEINRFDLWVQFDPFDDNFVVNFKQRLDTGPPRFLFTYNPNDPADEPGSLLEAEPDFSINDQVTDVEVLLYDRKRRVIERTTISDANPEEDLKLSSKRVGPGQLKAKKSIQVGARVRFSAFGQVNEAISDMPFRNKKQAANFVQNFLRERERDFLLLSGTIVGLPLLRARDTHEIRGLGQRIDGIYRFINVRHEMQPGSIYRTTFTAHKVLTNNVARRSPTTRVEIGTAIILAAG